MGNLLDTLLAWDELLRGWIATWRHPVLDPLVWAITTLGARGGVWLTLGGALAFLRPTRAAGVWRMVLALCLAALVTNQVLKPAIARPRPFTVVEGLEVVGRPPATFGFPSGHAAEAFASAWPWPSSLAGPGGPSSAWPA